MSSLASTSSVLAMICVLVAVCLLNSANQVAGGTVSGKQQASSDDTIDLFPSTPECGPDEEPAFGVLPTCEPTCLQPRPACRDRRIFVVLDYVPCFCKKGMLREETSKKCVRESECPKAIQN